MIICAADSTIEPPWEDTDADGDVLHYGFDGVGYQHQCRDTSKLWEASARSEERAVLDWGWGIGDRGYGGECCAVIDISHAV